MLIKHLKEFYDLECTYYRQEHDPATFSAWKDALLTLDDRDVKRAISLWHADETEIESFGQLRPRGAFMPKAADIRSIVSRGKRLEAESGEEFKPCNAFQENVDVNGRNWPELFCSGGHLYLRTTIPIRHPDTGALIRENSAVRPMRNCDCWLRWKAGRAA